MPERLLASLLLAAVSWLLPAAVTGAQPAAAAKVSSDSRWLGSDDRPLPFVTDAEVLAFLRTAEIVARKEIIGGVNRPLKVRLRQDGVEANAIFRTVEVRRKRVRLDGKLIADFHDSYVYECAAWEVSQLLGLDAVPPCVERRLGLAQGTMQLWVESAMTEFERRATNTKPPQQLRWMRQKQTMRLFDALIYNFDRNQGNMLIDAGWKLWLIDHTRSFRKSAVVEQLDKIVWCERGLFERLKALDEPTLSRRLRSLINGIQVDMLLKRRDTLVRHLNTLIAETTESAVLWDAGRPGRDSSELAQILIDDDIPATSSKLEDP